MADQKLIPELRFPEFKGEWVVRSLGALGDYFGGGTPDTSIIKFWKGSIPWISSSDIEDYSIHHIEKTRFITENAIIESATKLIPKGGILMVSRVGIGKFAVADQDLCTSQDFTNLISPENEYFLAYYFTARSNRFLRLSQGTSIKGFTIKDIKSAKFLIPSVSEQQKIASFLTAVDKRIQLLEEKKKQLERYKQGVMQKIFPSTDGQAPEIRFKDEEGNDFPDWEEKRLGEVLTVGSGRDYKHLNAGDIPVYGTGGYMLSVDDYLYDGESVCIGRKGTIDKPMFLSEKFWTVDTLFYTHSYNDVLAYFVFLIFQQINWQRHNEASGVPSLSKATIEKIKVVIPTALEEQQKIASFISSLDDSIEKCNRQIGESTLFKKGLLQKMFV